MALLPDGPIDTLGYLDQALGVVDEVERAVDDGPRAGVPAATDVDHVVVVTDGASRTVADLVAALTAPVSTVPVLALGADRLPAHVGPRSLVIAVGSATGEEAAAAGAHVVSIDVDGPVRRLGVLPATVRALAVLEQVGCYAELPASVSAAVAQLRRRRDELTGPRDPAVRLARRIGRTLPLVYGADALGGAAARRWKAQVNTGAKAASFANWLPDLADTEIAGWGQHGDMTRQVFSLVVLRHDHEPPGTDGHVERLDGLLDEVVHARHVVEAAGSGSLAQLFDLVFYGDLVAYHLAQELEIDPGPATATTT